MTLRHLEIIIESFHVKRSNLVEVCAQTDPDLPSYTMKQIGDSAHMAP